MVVAAAIGAALAVACLIADALAPGLGRWVAGVAVAAQLVWIWRAIPPRQRPEE